MLGIQKDLVQQSASSVELPDENDVNPKVWAFYRYWDSLHSRDCFAPKWADFDPTDIPSLLANVFLFSVYNKPLRFRFRLMGENILNAGGPGRPGLWVDEVPPTVQGVHLEQILVQVVKDNAPKWYKGPPMLVHHRQVKLLEGVMVPFASSNDTTSTVACCTVYTWRNGSVT